MIIQKSKIPLKIRNTSIKMLNRLSIVEVDVNTPKIVLEEIAQAHSVRYLSTNEDKNYVQRVIDKIRKAIEEEKGEKEKQENTKYLEDPTMLKKIARYVNGNCTWKKPALITAFNFLSSFHEGKNLHILFNKDKTFHFGLQTPENPISINANVLYSFLSYHKINTNFHTTFQQMCLLKDMILHFDEASLKQNILYQLRFSSSLTPSALINIFSSLSNSSLSNTSLENENSNNQNYNYNKEEILKKAALEFKLDLSDIDNLEELQTEWKSLSAIYKQNEKHRMIQGMYFPINSKVRERLKNSLENRFSIDNIFLDCKFNPKLGEDYYSNEDLLKLCNSEGHKFVTELGLDPYALLQSLESQPTFYHGKVTSFSSFVLQNQQTTFLENYDDLSSHSIIIYVSNNIIEGMEGTKQAHFFTYAELCETFSVKKQFRNPRTREIFGEENINKLFLMTQQDRKSNETIQEYEERRELGEEIERIRLYNENTDRDIKNFVATYETLDEWNKKRIEYALTTLLDTAMYMRNWNGSSNYPLSSEATNFPPDEQILVDHRVTQALLQFDNYIKELGLIGKTILQLPLIMYVRESDKFLSVTDSNEGLTIEQRIRIVKKGENDRGGNSCIRLSSNRFIATSYYYMVLIGMRIPFSINQVTYIS